MLQSHFDKVELTEFKEFTWRNGLRQCCVVLTVIPSAEVAVRCRSHGAETGPGRVTFHSGISRHGWACLGASWRLLAFLGVLAVLASSWISWHIPANLGGWGLGGLGGLGTTFTIGWNGGVEGGIEGSETERGRWEAARKAPEWHGLASTRIITMPSMGLRGPRGSHEATPPRSIIFASSPTPFVSGLCSLLALLPSCLPSHPLLPPILPRHFRVTLAVEVNKWTVTSNTGEWNFMSV